MRTLFFGKNGKGEDYSDDFNSARCVSFAKTLRQYRFCDQSLYDRLFELMQSRVDQVSEERAFNYMLYCTAYLPQAESYERVRQTMEKKGLLRPTTSQHCL
jgi:hypothetical protein